MMHFVSRGFVDDLLRCIARMDIDTAPLTDGLDFPTNESHPPSKVVPWDDFATPARKARESRRRPDRS